MKRWVLLSAVVLVSISTPIVATAQIENGDFSGGGASWFVGVPAGWEASFPDSGGNPDGYGRIENFGQIEGRGCINQNFKCGEEGGRTVCQLDIQYRLDLNDGQNRTSGRVVIRIDGVDVYTSPAVAPQGWQVVMLNVPCGYHNLGLCLEADGDKNNWTACFDNVTAECQSPPVPVESGTWGKLKALYR